MTKRKNSIESVSNLPPAEPGHVWKIRNESWLVHSNPNKQSTAHTPTYHRLSGPAVIPNPANPYPSLTEGYYWLDGVEVSRVTWKTDPRVIDFHIERGFYAS